MTVHISRNTDCRMSTAPTYLGGNVTGKGEKTTPICVLYCFTKSVYYFCKQNFLVFFLFGTIPCICGILVPQPETEPTSPALKACSLNH